MTILGMSSGEAGARVALVTGGSRGIGAEIVYQLAHSGFRVCFTYRADEAAATEVVKRLTTKSPPGAIIAIRADVTSLADMEEAFDAAERLGRLEVLVNNAGVTGTIGPFALGDHAQTRDVIDINLVAPIMACRLALQRWAGDETGRCIVNVSSAAATLGAPHEYVPYAAAKAGVDTLTVGLAKELGPLGVRVNAVSPGTTDTGIHAAAGEPNRVERVSARIPFGRAAQPGEVAAAVAWLASPEASYVSGAVLRVAGGL